MWVNAWRVLVAAVVLGYSAPGLGCSEPCSPCEPCEPCAPCWTPWNFLKEGPECCESSAAERRCDECSFFAKVPQWVKRYDFNIHFNSHGKAIWSLEGIQPIYQSPCSLRHTLFYQSRWAFRGNDSTANFGLGYRYLFPNECWLVGSNLFYDLTTKRHHSRLGWGLELFCPYAMIRSNFYFALSHLRTISHEDGIKTTERALGGWDLSGEVPVPCLPWASLRGTYYHWKGKDRDDINGGTICSLMNLTNFFTLEAGYSKDNRDHNTYVRLEFHLGRPCRVEHTLMCQPVCCLGVATPFNLRARTLERVRRHDDIVVEKVHTGGPGLIIARGT